MALVALFILLFNLLTVHSSSSTSCDVSSSSSSSSDPIPKLAHYFTTKTRYEEVNPHLIQDILLIKESWVKAPAPECKAVHLSAIVRHGTRYPTTKNIRKILQFWKLVKSGADLSCLKELQSWRNWYKEDMDGRLVEKGQFDHKHLATRLIRSFPGLITKPNVEAGRVKFISSSKHRCVNSTLAFKQGVLEELSMMDVDLQHTVNDELMRFFDSCRRLVETVENNKDAVVEVEKFNAGAEMKRIQEKLADHLQLPYSNVTADSVEAAFYLCAYEFTILNLNSPWCHLFDHRDGEVMEYAGDLKQFWKRGFGHDINSKASCVLFHDLFNRLEMAANQTQTGEEVSEVLTVQVGHAETLLPLITLLDLFKGDAALTASDFASQSGRVFRSGKIVPYASNLLVALYSCQDGLRLQFRLNEQPVLLPGLEELSPLYQDVRRRYEELLKGCDQNTVCSMDN